MCAKVISISYTCWATYNNQKTTPGQEVHKFYQFQALFLAYWGFQNTRLKWQILPLVWVVQRQNAFSFRGLRPLNPWPGAPPPDPCYRLAPRARHESYSRLLSTPLFSTWRRPCCIFDNFHSFVPQFVLSTFCRSDASYFVLLRVRSPIWR